MRRRGFLTKMTAFLAAPFVCRRLQFTITGPIDSASARLLAQQICAEMENA